MNRRKNRKYLPEALYASILEYLCHDVSPCITIPVSSDVMVKCASSKRHVCGRSGCVEQNIQTALVSALGGEDEYSILYFVLWCYVFLTDVLFSHYPLNVARRKKWTASRSPTPST